MPQDLPVLANGYHLVLKRDCPTCVTLEPVVAELVAHGIEITLYSQDDPAFPKGFAVVDDRDLAVSWHRQVETVPTLLRIENGVEVGRIVGWDRAMWQDFTAHTLTSEIADFLPGCGSKVCGS